MVYVLPYPMIGKTSISVVVRPIALPLSRAVLVNAATPSRATTA